MTKEQWDKASKKIEKLRQWMRDDSELFVSVQSFLVAIGKSPSPREELLQSFSDTSETADHAARLVVDLAAVCLAMLAMDIMQEESAKMN